MKRIGSGLGVFGILWFSQLISLVGSTLTGFALGVWVYQQTHSVTEYALISLFTSLPGLLIAPLAGTLVDRWDRRWAMVLSDVLSAVGTVAIVALLAAGRLQYWHIYITTALTSIGNAFQWPAYSATIALLVPKEQLGRVSGMSQAGVALARLLSPLLAGYLLLTIHLQGIVLIDFVTFLVSLFTLVLLPIPNPQGVRVPTEERWSVWADALDGWRYIVSRPGLLGLIIYFGASNFLVGVIWVLATPLVLSFSSTAVLGTILSVGGSGMLVGTLFMSTWGGPKQRILGVLGFSLLSGLCMLVAGLRPSPWLFGGAVFLFFFSRPVIEGCSMVVLQSKVEPSIQGRVFALSGMLASAAVPIASVIAGPLADGVFEPLLAPQGPLAASLGPLLGVGPGRGIGLLFVLMGLLTWVVTLGAFGFPRLRLIEKELPDAIEGSFPPV